MIRRGTFHCVAQLERAIYQWLAIWNPYPNPCLESRRGCHSRQGAPLQRSYGKELACFSRQVARRSAREARQYKARTAQRRIP